jgi:predicted membrane channel-forming protein YqfA (hemolysin III family)
VTTDQPATRLTLTSVVPVWSVAVVGSVLIGLFVPRAHYLDWVPFVLAADVLLTFCIQLAIVQKEGLVDRMMACLGGSVVILGVATLVLGILQLSAG